VRSPDDAEHQYRTLAVEYVAMRSLNDPLNGFETLSKFFEKA